MTTDVREKLAALLREVQYLGGLEEKIADHLIANGVTVQESKVNDTIYEVDGEHGIETFGSITERIKTI